MNFDIGTFSISIEAIYHGHGPWSSRNGNSYVVDQDPTATISRLESIFYLGNVLLRDGDVFGMANSLEIRVPFLDRDLVDWAYRLPGDTLLPAGEPAKFLLRRMCAEFYSDAQLGQKKRGFTPPFSTWLMGPLREVMEESLGAVKGSGLVDPKGVERIRAAFVRDPESSIWSRVWALVTLGYWLTRHRTEARLHNCANVEDSKVSILSE